MLAKPIFLLAAAVTAGSAVPAPQAVPRRAVPQRIVSVGLCADQLVLALADRSQIAGLSRNAADPEMSGAAAKARGLPILRDVGEALVVTAPDMIVATSRRPLGMLDALDPRSYRLIEAPDASSYPAILVGLRQVGRAVGHADRAEAMIRGMDARLAAVPRTVGRGRVAAYYQRRGYMTGTRTLIDDLMTRLGLVNLAGRLGKPALSQLTLEEIVAARPDVLILESSTATVRDQGTEMLHHPALRRIPKLWVPQAWTVCGSPDYVLAAESLARQIERLDR